MQRHELLSQEAWSRPGECLFCPRKRTPWFFLLKLKFRIFWFWGNAYGAIAVTVAWIQDCDKKPMFHLQSKWSPETHLLSCAYHVRNFRTEPIHFVLWRFVNILGTQRSHNFFYPNFSVIASRIVVLDTSGMMCCNSLIVTRQFARISPSISWRRSSEIKDGLPLLCSSWSSVLRRIHGTTSSHFADS